MHRFAAVSGQPLEVKHEAEVLADIFASCYMLAELGSIEPPERLRLMQGSMMNALRIQPNPLPIDPREARRVQRATLRAAMMEALRVLGND